MCRLQSNIIYILLYLDNFTEVLQILKVTYNFPLSISKPMQKVRSVECSSWVCILQINTKIGRADISSTFCMFLVHTKSREKWPLITQQHFQVLTCMKSRQLSVVYVDVDSKTTWGTLHYIKVYVLSETSACGCNAMIVMLFTKLYLPSFQ